MDPTKVSVLDGAIVVALVLFAIEGLRRGLFRETLDLVGIVVAGLLAYYGAGAAGTWLGERIGLPVGPGLVLGYCLVFIVVLVLLGLTSGPIVAYFSGGRRSLLSLNALGGFAFGVAKGLVVVAIALRGLALLPLSDDFRETLGQSWAAPRIDTLTERALPFVQGVFGEVTAQAARVDSQVSGTEPLTQPVSIPHGVTVWADPESEDVLLALVNQERQTLGLRPLILDEAIRTAARRHSEEMFRLGYFAHDSPIAGTPFDRLRQANVGFGMAGENLAYAPNVEAAHRGLMNSPEHRRNILEPGYRRIGTGVVRLALSGRMFTEDFAD